MTRSLICWTGGERKRKDTNTEFDGKQENIEENSLRNSEKTYASATVVGEA